MKIRLICLNTIRNRLLKAKSLLVVNGIDIDLYARLNMWLLKK